MDLHHLIENKCSSNEFRLALKNRNVDEYFWYKPSMMRAYQRTIIFSAIQFNREDLVSIILKKNPNIHCLETYGSVKTFAVELAFAENYEYIYKSIRRYIATCDNPSLYGTRNSNGHTVYECIEIHTFMRQQYPAIHDTKRFDIMAIHGRFLINEMNRLYRFLNLAIYRSDFIKKYVVDTLIELYPIQFLKQSSELDFDKHKSGSLFKMAIINCDIEMIKYLLSKLDSVSKELSIPYKIEMDTMIEIYYPDFFDEKPTIYDILLKLMSPKQKLAWLRTFLTSGYIISILEQIIPIFFSHNTPINLENGREIEEELVQKYLCKCYFGQLEAGENCDSSKTIINPIYVLFKNERSRRDIISFTTVFSIQSPATKTLFLKYKIFDYNVLDIIKKYL